MKLLTLRDNYAIAYNIDDCILKGPNWAPNIDYEKCSD